MGKAIQTKPEPSCPYCGQKMVLRRPGPYNSWPSFWGCPNYPDCQGTREIMPDGIPEEDDQWLMNGATDWF